MSLWTVACQAPASMGFPRKQYWSGLPFSSSGGLSYQGIEPASPALVDGFSTTGPLGKPKEDIPVVKKHVKRCSASLIIREIQIKTIMRYHVTPARMVIIKKSVNNEC